MWYKIVSVFLCYVPKGKLCTQTITYFLSIFCANSTPHKSPKNVSRQRFQIKMALCY